MKKFILFILLVGIAGGAAYYFFVYKKHNAPLDVQMYVKALDKALGSSEMVNNYAMTYKGTFLENKNVVCAIEDAEDMGPITERYQYLDPNEQKEVMITILAALPSELKSTAFKAFRNNEFNIIFRLTGNVSQEHVDIIIQYNEITE